MRLMILDRRHPWRSIRWLNVAVALMVLVAAPALGFALAELGIEPWLPVGLFAGLIALLLWGKTGEPYRSGIFAMALAGGMLGFVTLPTGSESRLVISLVIALGLIGRWLLEKLFIERRLVLKPSPVNRPLLLFVAVCIISYLWSQFMRDELLFVWSSFPMVQIAALVVNITLPLVLLLAANEFDDEAWVRRFAYLLVGMAVTGATIYLIREEWHAFFFVRGSLGLAGMWACVIAYALALFSRRAPLWLRAALLGYVGLQVYLSFFLTRMWVSGWLPLGIACVIVTLLRSRRLFLICMLAGTLYVGANFDYYYETIVVAQEEEGSGSARVALWLNNLNHVKNHPLFGMGPAGYAPYNMTYHAQDARSTHNNYFDILAQTGIIGALTFIWLAITLISMALHTWKRLAGSGSFLEAFSAAAFGGTVAAFAGMMLGDWVLPFAYNQTISGFDNAVFTWLMFGIMAAMHRRVVMGIEPAPAPPVAPFAAALPLDNPR